MSDDAVKKKEAIWNWHACPSSQIEYMSIAEKNTSQFHCISIWLGNLIIIFSSQERKQ